MKKKRNFQFQKSINKTMRIKYQQQIENKLEVLIEGETSDYCVCVWFEQYPLPKDIGEYVRTKINKEDTVFCSCPDYQVRKRECKHIKFVKENL